MNRIVGIDLGTTNSAVAVLEGESSRIIPNPSGGRITPSVVALRGAGEILVGEQAKRVAAADAPNTIFSIKRFMGRRRSEVAEEERLVPYPLAGGAEEPVRVQAAGRPWSPPEISAHILRYLRGAAEGDLGEPVERAVITVPAYFNDGQRQATKEAGEIAGFKVERILNEPTAAAMAYGIDRKLAGGKIAVFDLGGGTFDISILELNQGIFQVLAVNGDTHLGGDDLDQRIVEWLARGFEAKTGVNLLGDPRARETLRAAAEAAKCRLSTEEEVAIEIPFIAGGPQGPLHLARRLTRAELEGLVADLVERCRRPCLLALADAGLAPEEIREVILVGGCTRMPAVRTLVREVFRREPDVSVNPEEAVALGAAIQAGVLAGSVKDLLLLDVTPLSLGIETYGGVMAKLIHRNSTIPCSAKEVFTTFVDGQQAVDIHILQGERELARDNRTLDRFQLAGIPPLPAGMPKIEVTFTIDANGILSVSARDLRSGAAHSVEVKPSSGLTEAEVQRMVQESLEHAHADMAQRFLIETRAEAEKVVSATEKVLAEAADLVRDGEKAGIVAALTAAKESIAGDDPQAIKAAMDRLNEATFDLAHRLIERAAQVSVEKGLD